MINARSKSASTPSAGRFITLEGGEGAGKSSCLQTIVNLLQRRGIATVATREPGGTALGERLRDILLDSTTGAIDADAELLTVFAARAQHLKEVIEPALARGSWVICDRFTDASYAYQGGGRGIDTERIALLEQWVQGSRRPDLTLLLDVSPELGLRRATAGRQADRFEDQKLAFFERVRSTYLARAKLESERMVVIDADQSIEAVVDELTAAVSNFLTSLPRD